MSDSETISPDMGKPITEAISGLKPDMVNPISPHPFSDTLTTAERMRQFEHMDSVLDQVHGRIETMGMAELAALQGDLKKINALIDSAISDRLVDFDIEGHGQATAWLNDHEIRLDFDYLADTEGPGPATHCLQIIGAECGPTDNWAALKLTPEQAAQAEAALLPMYVKWLDARTEEGA
jgi:hypothetical protein